jgi:CRISPR-associated protein Csm2
MAYSNNQGRPYTQGRPTNQNHAASKKLTILFTDDTYVNEAEAVIQEMKQTNFRESRDTLTMSQLRNLSSLTSNIYDEVQNNDVSQVSDKLAYLRVQFVYQSGRNAAIKKLVELADILGILKTIQAKNDRSTIIRFCRYMEALVAYFKYYGGQD